jgi:hypothetical protein
MALARGSPHDGQRHESPLWAAVASAAWGACEPFVTSLVRASVLQHVATMRAWRGRLPAANERSSDRNVGARVVNRWSRQAWRGPGLDGAGFSVTALLQAAADHEMSCVHSFAWRQPCPGVGESSRQRGCRAVRSAGGSELHRISRRLVRRSFPTAGRTCCCRPYLGDESGTIIAPLATFAVTGSRAGL